jgi:hypothetical protein
LKAYFLHGIDKYHILVFKSDDPEDIYRIIKRLGASRDREIRALAEKLETDWFRREDQNKRERKKNK